MSVRRTPPVTRSSRRHSSPSIEIAEDDGNQPSLSDLMANDPSLRDMAFDDDMKPPTRSPLLSPSPPPPPSSGHKAAAKAALKPDMFTGDQASHHDITRFLFLLGNYMVLTGITTDLQLGIALTFLGGPALDWAMGRTFTTFADFKTGLTNAFAPFNPDLQARQRLNSIKHTSSATTYVNSFRQAALLVKDTTDSDLFSRFIEGLQAKLRADLLAHNVRTFDEAASMATRIDLANNFASSYSSPSTSTPPPPKPRLNATSLPSTFTSSGPKPKLTEDERAHLLRTGGCLYCRQPGHTVDRCPTCPSSSGKGPGAQ